MQVYCPSLIPPWVNCGESNSSIVICCLVSSEKLCSCCACLFDVRVLTHGVSMPNVDLSAFQRATSTCVDIIDVKYKSQRYTLLHRAISWVRPDVGAV